MLQILVAISLKFCYRKEAWGYAKVIHEKKMKKKYLRKKMDKCPNCQNNGYLDARLKKEKRKEMNKIALVFLQMFPNSKREISFQGA